MTSPALLSLTLRRAPFYIYAKRAPAGLLHNNSHKDFPYFFFSDAMIQGSGLSTVPLLPERFKFPNESQFRDETATIFHDHRFPSVKVSTAPWATPTITSIVETRSTCIQGTTDSDKECYVLSCFAPYDDVEMGVTAFRTALLPAPREPLSHVPESWYTLAFEQFPMAIRLLCDDNEFDPTVIAANQLADQDFAVHGSISALDRIRQVPVPQHPHGTEEYQAFHVGGLDYRLWIWRLPDNSDGLRVYAVAYRRKHDVLPTIVEHSMTSRIRRLDEKDDFHY